MYVLSKCVLRSTYFIRKVLLTVLVQYHFFESHLVTSSYFTEDGLIMIPQISLLFSNFKTENMHILIYFCLYDSLRLSRAPEVDPNAELVGPRDLELSCTMGLACDVSWAADKMQV